MLAPAIDALPGWRAVTDLSTAIGTVALVAVGPSGIYVVDTVESEGMETLADAPEPALIHAWAQAKHLERRRVGGDVSPVLAVDGPGDVPSGRRRGVHVLAAADVVPWLVERPEALSPGDARLLGARLDDTSVPSLALVA